MNRRILKTGLLVFVIFIIVNNLLFLPHNILCWDVFGYYLYLPLQFIYHNPYQYRALDSEKMDLQLNRWNSVTYDYLTPEVRKKKDLLKVYFWNRSNGRVFIDDLQVEVLEKNE